MLIPRSVSFARAPRGFRSAVLDGRQESARTIRNVEFRRNLPSRSTEREREEKKAKPGTRPASFFSRVRFCYYFFNFFFSRRLPRPRPHRLPWAADTPKWIPRTSKCPTSALSWTAIRICSRTRKNSNAGEYITQNASQSLQNNIVNCYS